MDACSSSSRATPSVPGGPNEHFATEAEAARALGIVVRTIDHDALTAGDVRVAVRLVDEPSDDAVYREWMVRSEHYDLLGHALVARDVRLRASPADYRRAHELPGWYDAFSGLTPESRWLASAGVDGIDVLLRGFPAGAAVLKDYVKSMKHRWDERPADLHRPCGADRRPAILATKAASAATRTHGAERLVGGRGRQPHSAAISSTVTSGRPSTTSPSLSGSGVAASLDDRGGTGGVVISRTGSRSGIRRTTIRSAATPSATRVS